MHNSSVKDGLYLNDFSTQFPENLNLLTLILLGTSGISSEFSKNHLLIINKNSKNNSNN